MHNDATAARMRHTDRLLTQHLCVHCSSFDGWPVGAVSPSDSGMRAPRTRVTDGDAFAHSSQADVVEAGKACPRLTQAPAGARLGARHDRGRAGSRLAGGVHDRSLRAEVRRRLPARLRFVLWAEPQRLRSRRVRQGSCITWSRRLRARDVGISTGTAAIPAACLRGQTPQYAQTFRSPRLAAVPVDTAPVQ